MLDLKNPIPKLITDPKELTERIKGLNIYPYAGKNRASSHKVLEVLYDLFELSPSRGTVINDKRDVGFSGKCDIEWTGIRGLSFDDKEITDAEKLAFVERIESVGLEFADLINLAYDGELDVSVSGNVFILYRESVIAGVKQVKLDILDPRHCYPLIVEEGEAEAIMWTPQMGDKQPKEVEVYNLYPFMNEDRTTVFHFKLGAKGVWGRPTDLMAFKWMVVEALIALRESKLANTDLAAKLLIIAEDEEADSPIDGEDEDGKIEQTGLQKQIISLRQIAGTENEKTVPIAGLIYPFGGQRPHVEKLDISRDYQYLKAQTDIASDYIYAANSWSKELVGFTQAKGGIGSNMINSLFKWKYVTKIKPRQEWWSTNLGKILNHMFEEKVGYSIAFPNRLEQFIEEHEDVDQPSGSQNIGEIDE